MLQQPSELKSVSEVDELPKATSVGQHSRTVRRGLRTRLARTKIKAGVISYLTAALRSQSRELQ
jgi:hypothetical protein